MRSTSLVLVILLFAGLIWAQDDNPDLTQYLAYRQVVMDTVNMVRNSEAQQLASAHGLQILNVTWEDTGRFQGSSVGPNISDMTIQVQIQDPRTQAYSLHCMPVIRFPNFTDRTGDVSLDDFFLLVGNERGIEDLQRVSLRQFLGNLREYLSTPDSWTGEENSLLAERDTHVLVSAQACFLPIPREGIAEFNPVLFNYQSSQGNPAVLTILATREGTSVTIIDNVRDGFEAGQTWGQRLFFNADGQRAVLTGQRLSDFQREQQPEATEDPEATPDEEPTVQAAAQEGLNMVLLIQVPLVHRPLERWDEGYPDDFAEEENSRSARSPGSDVEEAVVGHGRVEGPFTEIDGMPIRRDERFPIRVTVQFYKATSNGVVSEADMAGIAAQIERVYEEADYVGSLVVDGPQGRPTEHDGPQFEPPDWWDNFWRRHRSNTGMTPLQTLQMLRRRLGDDDWVPRDAQHLEETLRSFRQEQQDDED